MQKDIFKFALILGLVVVIAAGALAWVNDITKPKIIAQQKKAVQEALTFVLPDAIDGVVIPFPDEENVNYYTGYKNPDTTNMFGYAFLTFAKGYSSTIRTMVGIDTTGSILRIKVLSQQETPGLGTKCEEVKSGETEAWWQVQFKDQNASAVLVDKDGGDIVSLTGATITSRAITDAIRLKSTDILQSMQTNELE